MNFLNETLAMIKDSGHEVTDIAFIGSESGFSCTWDEFKVLADVDYDDGFGSAEVAGDLVILFSDGEYLRRDEYDGAESWELVQRFPIPKKTKPIKRLVGKYWPSLAKLQDDKNTFYIDGTRGD